MSDSHEALQERIMELEIKASYTEDLLEQLNMTIYRQQQQIDLLINEVRELKRQAPEGGGAMVRNLLDALSQLLLLVNACLAFALRVDLFVLVLFNTVAAVLVAITVVVIIFREIGKLSNEVLQLDPQLFKRMIRYGLKFYISVVAGIIILRVDLLLVNKLRGPSEAGIYAIAAQMSTLLILLPSVIATLLFPRVSAVKDIDGELTMRATRHTAFVMFIVCILAVPLAFALPYVYGQSFRGSTLQLLILLPGVLLLGIESVMVQHFNAQGLPFTIPLFWIICVLVNVVLNLIFIPRFGAIGAAVISTVTYALIFVLVATYFRTKTGNRLSTVLFLNLGKFWKRSCKC